MVRVTFLGSGDAFGSGGRFQTCILVEGEGSSFLFDCGASSLIAMRRFGVDPNAISTILIGHLHGDHFGGVPFFLLDAQFISRRSEPLIVAGPSGTEERIDRAMDVLFPNFAGMAWKFALDVHELEPGQEHNIGDIRATPYVVDHPSGAPPTALRVAIDDRIITYSGDTQWTPNLIPAARDADLFIAETYSYDKTVPHHMSYEGWQAHKHELGAKRIVATHMSSNSLRHVDEMEFEIAEDGKVFEV
ncbi:MAG: MBL fold metallo-hydrolase [Gammaproteobacteria bacterium]